MKKHKIRIFYRFASSYLRLKPWTWDFNDISILLSHNKIKAKYY